jgi:outer membrane protein OmpA-like peptidoglycan-associated protein
MLRKPLLTLTTLSALIVNVGVYAADCGIAQQYFEKGVAAGKAKDWQEAQNWLSKSVAECNKFDNWYLLGQAEQKLENNEAAASAFEDARRYAKNNDQTALAIARYAEVQASQGKIAEPLTLLHEARKMHSTPPAWIKDLAISLDKKRTEQPLTVAQVTGALHNRSIKLFKLDTKPNINVNINFEYNSTDVVPVSVASIDVLAEALGESSFDGKNITIVGHSDARGSHEYNLELSEKRAEYIVQALVERQPKLAGRLNISGLGETKPLYDGETEDIYLLNRRIEVQLDE